MLNYPEHGFPLAYILSPFKHIAFPCTTRRTATYRDACVLLYILIFILYKTNSVTFIYDLKAALLKPVSYTHLDVYKRQAEDGVTVQIFSMCNQRIRGVRCP